MKIAITGATGFLGWHLRCRAFAQGITCFPIGRSLFADDDRLAEVVGDVDAVLHCAGVNRGTDAEVSDGNIEVARQLSAAARRADRPLRIVYANSVHCREDTAYGRAKRRAAEELAGPAGSPVGFSDVILPNLYGEHGRPHYNSFVATFCHQTAHGERPRVDRDREIPLMHVQDAADVLLEETRASSRRCVEPKGEPTAVSAVRELLAEFEEVYRHGEIPDLTNPWRTKLFNTYRSHLVPARYPMALTPRTDVRGTLVECVRAPAAGGQAFVSSTVPGAVRGEHVHLRKFERFVIVGGQAEISIRRLFSNQIMRFNVDGDRPVAIDMPTMWAHSLTATGDRPVLGFFWTNELYSPEDPDTFACAVNSPSEGS